MIKLFGKKQSSPSESTPQLTIYERRNLEIPGPPSTGLSYATYQQMEKDAMVQTALSIKKLGVLAAPFKVIPTSQSPSSIRNADFVQESFERMEGSALTVLQQAMDAFSKGWSIQEKVWEYQGGQAWLRAVRAKDPANFGLEVSEYGQVTALKLQIPGIPDEVLPRDKFVLYVNRPVYGQPKGSSDLDAAYKHWQSKSTLLAAWKAHLERFASPTVLGKFERGLTPDEQGSILAALQNLQNNTAILYPNEIDISTLGGQRESSSGFIEAIEYHNREIARSILGQTLTTDEGRRVGSLALGKVHLQVLLLQLEAIRRDLADIVMTEQVIRPMIELNFGPEDIPSFEFNATPISAFTTGTL